MYGLWNQPNKLLIAFIFLFFGFAESHTFKALRNPGWKK